jgi:fructose-1-phosphate kinase PfkB-like protein
VSSQTSPDPPYRRRSPAGLDLAKLSDDELTAQRSTETRDLDELRRAAERLRDASADNVLITRAVHGARGTRWIRIST